MRIGRLVILPWSKRNFIPRMVLIFLALGWMFFLAWGATLLWQDTRLEEQRAQQQAQQQQRLKDKARQQAQYQQMLQQRSGRNQNGVQNAIDGVKK